MVVSGSFIFFYIGVLLGTWVYWDWEWMRSPQFIDWFIKQLDKLNDEDREDIERRIHDLAERHRRAKK